VGVPQVLSLLPWVKLTQSVEDAMAFKPLPRSSDTPKEISEPLVPPMMERTPPDVDTAVSNTPDTVTSAKALEITAKEATATRVLIELVLTNNKNNIHLTFLPQ
jgi:hypothetical protein